jgi:ABC-type antimicrobial peptide transport system permease subunit
MDDVVSSSLSQPRFVALLLGMFSLLAVCLAAVGVYGVVSNLATERAREFSIRMALGARRSDVVWMVLSRGLLLMATGAAIGLGAALLLTPAVGSLLFRISPTDPGTLAAVLGLLLVVGMVACCLPAWRAARNDPSVALREE